PSYATVLGDGACWQSRNWRAYSDDCPLAGPALSLVGSARPSPFRVALPDRFRRARACPEAQETVRTHSCGSCEVVGPGTRARNLAVPDGIRLRSCNLRKEPFGICRGATRDR